MDNNKNTTTEAVETTASAKKQKKENRKISKTTVAVIITVCVVLLASLSITVTSLPWKTLFSSTKTYTVDELTITLPKDFHNIQDISGVNGCFGSEKMTVFVIKESVLNFPDGKNTTLESYRLKLLQAKGLTYNDIKTTDDTVYFCYDYTAPLDNRVYTYYTFNHKTEDNFWTVKFSVEKSTATAKESEIIKLAKTVTFNTATETTE